MQLLSIINISWPTYFAVIGTLLLIYWFIIGSIYYRKDIKILLSGKRPTMQATHAAAINPFEASQQIFAAPETSGDAPFIADDDETPSAEFPLVYALADEVKAFIGEAAQKHMIKQEMAQGIHSLFLREPYIQLQTKAFRVAINNVVAMEAEQQCDIIFTDQEVEALWIR